MITVALSDFVLELKDGVVKHVGPSDTTATAKLYDVDQVAVRPFGDERLKFVFEDDAGSVVHVAVDRPQAQSVVDDIVRLLDEGSPAE